MVVLLGEREYGRASVPYETDSFSCWQSTA